MHAGGQGYASANYRRIRYCTAMHTLKTVAEVCYTNSTISTVAHGNVAVAPQRCHSGAFFSLCLKSPKPCFFSLGGPHSPQGSLGDPTQGTPAVQTPPHPRRPTPSPCPPSSPRS